MAIFLIWGWPRSCRSMNLGGDRPVDADHQRPFGVISDRPGVDQVEIGQVADELLIGSHENIKRSACLDLLGEPSRGIEREARGRSGPFLKSLGESGQDMLEN